VWKVDRLGRSLREMLDTTHMLQTRGIKLRSLTAQVDTETATGRLMFNFLGTIAEYFLDLNRERTMEGLKAARGRKGVRCWFAPHDMPIGAKIIDALDEAIRLRDKVLLILSENAIASDWVEDEVSKAYAEERKRKQIVLFPVRLDNTVMKTEEPWASKLRDQRNIGDFTRWKDHDAYRKSFERLMHGLTVQQPSKG
jgi:DNA invertase Pin-like site-specific DNA recombinase